MANPIKLQRGTQITFGSDVGDDENWSTENIADNAGRHSDVRDWGAAPKEKDFDIQIFQQNQATPTLKDTTDYYVVPCGHATSEAHSPTGTFADGPISTVDQLADTDFIGSIVARAATANLEFSKSVGPRITDRHWGLALFNVMGSALTNDVAEIKAIVTPLFDEIQ